MSNWKDEYKRVLEAEPSMLLERFIENLLEQERQRMSEEMLLGVDTGVPGGTKPPRYTGSSKRTGW